MQNALMACKVLVKNENACITEVGDKVGGLGVIVHGVVRCTGADRDHDYLGIVCPSACTATGRRHAREQ